MESYCDAREFFYYETHVPAWRSFFTEKNLCNLKYSSERVSFCEEGVLRGYYVECLYVCVFMPQHCLSDACLWNAM